MPADGNNANGRLAQRGSNGVTPPLWQSLLTKYTLFVALIVVVTAGLLGHLAYVFARNILHHDIHVRMQIIAADRAALLEGYSRHQLERAALVTSRTTLRSLLKSHLEGTLEEQPFREQARTILTDAQSSSDGFRDLWITNPEGVVITATNDEILGQDFSDDPNFLQARDQPVLDVPRTVEGESVTRLQAPMRDEQGLLLGVLMVSLDAAPLVKLLTDRTGLERTGTVYVGTRRDDSVYYLIPPQDGERTVSLNEAPVMALALAGKSGAMVTTYHDVEVLAAYRPVAFQPGGDAAWGLVAKMNLQEAYAPVYRLRWTLFGLQMVLVLLGMAASFFVAQRVTRPVLELAETATTIAGGNLDVRVPHRSYDEVGVLGAAFNHMAAQLAEARDYQEERIERRTIELQRSQEELQQQQQILQSILDSMGDGVVVADEKGTFLLWNPAAEQIIGIGPQNVDPEKWSQVYGCYLPDGKTLCPPEELPLARALRGESLDGEILYLKNPDVPQGTWISITARPLRNEPGPGSWKSWQEFQGISITARPQGELLGGVIVVRDITEARQAQQELAARDEKNRAILATTHEAFVAIDERSIIREWNQQAEETFGWRREEAIGQSLIETVIPPGYRDQHRKGVEQFLRNGDGPVLNRRLELSALHRDGHEFPVELTITPVRQGDKYLFAAFVHDITEEKRAKDELQQAKEAAEAASLAKSSFLASMSHEIRTPMNAVIGMTELLLDTDLSPTQREYLTMVQESGEALLAVINDILDFSKIEAGRFDLEQAPFDLQECLGDTMKSLAVRAHRKNLELAFHLSPKVPRMIIGDRHRLRQIIVNLVGNSIKFTDEGEVVLLVHHATQKNGEVVLHFAVRDTGIGISKEKQARIFEAFQQADETMTRRFGGTGLGLAICSRLVEMMGGHIWVESEPARGSTFHFTANFQLAADHAPRIGSTSVEDLSGLRVLVVDDNETNCRILEEMLINWGMDSTCIHHAREALDRMRTEAKTGNAFDLVLVDAHMPGIDGFQLAEAIKRDRALRSSLIMMLTSSDRGDESVRRKELGVNASLTKPIKQSELFNAIATALGAPAHVAEEHQTQAAEFAARVPPLKVLLAEDSIVNQKLARALLEPHGHTVIVANNGREAVDLAASEEFDLILMDVQMPEMDGLEATRTIRKRERMQAAAGASPDGETAAAQGPAASEGPRHVPIIAMTAHALKGDRELCLEAGMDGYVSKPVRARQLYQAIEELLNPSLDEPSPRTPESEEPADSEAASLGAPVPPEGEDGVSEQEEPDAARQQLASGIPPREQPQSGSNPAALSDGDDDGILDWNAAVEKSQLSNDSFAEVAELFLSEAPKMLRQIDEAFTSDDATQLRRAAHTLKSSALLFEAHPAATAAQQLEELAHPGSLDEARPLGEQVHVEIERLTACLATRVTGQSPPDGGESAS
jgi:two-component system, sensor histidine kinase and response regulator